MLQSLNEGENLAATTSSNGFQSESYAIDKAVNGWFEEFTTSSLTDGGKTSGDVILSTEDFNGPVIGHATQVSGCFRGSMEKDTSVTH